METGTYVHNGLVCSIAAFKDHLKLNFFKRAELQDIDGLFNSGLDAKTSRGIDFFKDDVIVKEKLLRLIRIAIKQNDT